MKNFVIILTGAILIGIAFFFGKGCSKPIMPDHSTKVVTWDSANAILKTKEVITKKFMDSVKPIIKGLVDSIGQLKKAHKDNERFLSIRVKNLEELVTELLEDTTVSTTARERKCDSIVNALRAAYPTYQEQVAVVNRLIQKYDSVIVAKDSVEAVNVSLQGTLRRTNLLKDTIFTTVIKEDNAAAGKVKTLGWVAKGEAAIILALILKILLTK